jgi:hypothetical protein
MITVTNILTPAIITITTDINTIRVKAPVRTPT